MMFKGRALRFSGLVLCAILCWALAEHHACAQTTSDQVYRIVILDKQQRSDAERLKRMLEGWGYTPVQLDESNGLFRVMYGNFSTNAAAAQAMQGLQNEGISTRGVVVVGRPVAAAPSAAPGELYSVMVRDFNDPAQAQALQTRLQQSGYAPIIVRQIGRFYEVYVGNYSLEEATVALGQLRQQGFSTAKVKKVPPVAPAATAQGSTDASPDALAPAVTRTETWQRLSSDQQRQVINSVQMQQELRQGNPLAERVIDIDKRLQGLDQQVKTMITQVQKEKEVAEQKRQQINELYQDSDNLIRNGKYEEAILKLKAILDIDKGNEFGQRQLVQRRIDLCQSKLSGESYEGQKQEIEKQYRILEEQAKRLGASGEPRELERAISTWQQIQQLDPKYNETANTQIGMLTQRINMLTQNERAARDQAGKQLQMLIYGLGGAVGVMIVLVLLIWLRGRKRHLELMRKVQEITSIRPMRELEGSGPALLGANATESDIFSPRTPVENEAIAGDPLGGVLESAPVAPAKKGKDKGKKGKAAAAEAPKPESDDVFGDLSGMDAFGSPEPVATGGGGGDMGFDDIFGGAPQPAAAKAQVTTEVVSSESTEGPPPSDIDDIFGSLFENSEPAPAAEPVAAQATTQVSPADTDPGPITFSDMLAVGNPEPAPATDEQKEDVDLLAVFDSAVSNGNDDHLKDSPFAGLFDEPSPASQGTASPGKEDDTEIPSIKLDMTSAPETSTVNPLSLDSSGAPDSERTSTSIDLPAFSFEDLMPSGSGEESSAGGIELDFENDPAGQKPAGWEGDYAFASLSVQADTPPKGGHQYLAFEKKDGAGKALYTLNFPKINGTVGIEFDLRCNDKNKFLLGFYVEKDGDFQQAIHTKILRSEAQTTPTIHMQGESAPYLLGSWAHIKYVVDLGAGKINGYIDSTHVVRDLPLQQIPDYLNTLSIRDNINTTGSLLLGNIKVYKVQ